MLWSKVLHHPLKIGPWVGQTATSRSQKIGVEAEVSREFLWKRLLEHGVFLGRLPCRGEKGLSQVKASSMSYSDDLTVFPGVCGAKTWSSVHTWKNPKVRTVPAKGLSEDEEEELVLGRHWPPSLVWSAVWGSGVGRRTEAARDEGWGGLKGAPRAVKEEQRWRKSPGGRWGVWGMHESAPRKN